MKEKSEVSGAQREFDPERDRAAIRKLQDWDSGAAQDPAMKQQGGEPWWKSLIKKKAKL